jgi:hypothetical protein
MTGVELAAGLGIGAVAVFLFGMVRAFLRDRKGGES